MCVCLFINMSDVIKIIWTKSELNSLLARLMWTISLSSSFSPLSGVEGGWIIGPECVLVCTGLWIYWEICHVSFHLSEFLMLLLCQIASAIFFSQLGDKGQHYTGDCKDTLTFLHFERKSYTFFEILHVYNFLLEFDVWHSIWLLSLSGKAGFIDLII